MDDSSQINRMSQQPTKRKTGAHITRAQKLKLQSLLADQSELRTGKFTVSFTAKDGAKAWEEIACQLNAIPGAKKDWKAWRKTWQDIYSKIKGKQAAINRSRNQTGGGPPPPQLDEFEESVAALINPRVVSGHEYSHESAVVFNNTQDDVDASASADTDTVIIYQVVDPPNPTTPATTQRKKVNVKTLLKEKVEIKKKYYDEKLEIMRERNEKFEKIYQALQLISQSLTCNDLL